jgi:4-diphosphocytidyl-2-C-methyl-D-erythritol kinase
VSEAGHGSVTARAHAKLNVFLRVLGRRSDGYHDVESLVLPLEFADAVTVDGADAWSLTVRGPTSASVPDGMENVAMRAAVALARAVDRNTPGAAVVIEKRIPVAAGMGGGSADAAAVLRALNELWGRGLDPVALREVAATTGSDVPALLPGGAVYVSGRGERVEPVHVVTTWWVVRPFPFAVRTPDAYDWWDRTGRTGPDGGAVIAAAETGNDVLLGSALFNDLQGPVAGRHPEVARAVDAFLEAGALGAVMTGSGPTVVALARHLGHADQLATAVEGSFVTSGPPLRRA